MKNIIVGTAGHIDHGKTALVRALTGIETDRLKEEKERGISIDLGFAHLECGELRLGFVDVPGHERFIKNMLAGATGIDLVLLIVAADDSIMPQTREHLEILKLLGVQHGVIALTKCDLVDETTREVVELEIRELVRGSFLEAAPIVRTSAHSGMGIDELKKAILEACNCAELKVQSAESNHSAEFRIQSAESNPAFCTLNSKLCTSPWFRMPIDRSFVVQGHGTVVTGHPPGRGLVPGRPGRSRPCLHRSGGPDPVTATPVGPRRHRSTVGRCDQTSGTARCDRRGRTRLDQPRITGWGCWACNRSRADCMAPVISS